MPLDPQVEMLLKQMESAGAPPLNTLAPADARRLTAAMFTVPLGSEEPVRKVENRSIPGPAGQIPVRIYTPTGAGPFPMLVFIHGGGFVICDLDSHDAACRSLTNQANCVTVSIDYRLAPEHKFPAAVEDSYAAALWVSEHAKELNGDANRMAIGGDSAGGNLSAVVSMLARDAGKPKICFQLLVYPATDAHRNTESHRKFTDYFLTRDMIDYFIGHYLRGEADKNDPRMSIALAKNFKGLPPAHIITAEFDPLRDEGEAYAETLRKAGVAATVTRYPGMIHGFFTMANLLDQGKKAVAEAATALRKAFGN
ncbi:MAG TPA: alpha/beta hydrolase [Candidatus Binataceae bacterium]|nr:alpha/beta hydrolase [Candidatus Binataceae bacterium]